MNERFIVASTVLLAAGSAVGQEVVLDLPLPTFGFFETAFGSGNTELDGFTVVDARLFLEIEVTDGDAADVEFFQVFPIDFDPSTPVIDDGGVFTNGVIEGWSGTGTFSKEFDVSGAIGGAFLADIVYFGGLYGEFGQIFGPPGTVGSLSSNSVFQLTLVPAPASAVVLGAAAPLALRRRRK